MTDIIGNPRMEENKEPGTKPKRRMWKVAGKKAFGPRGKVPAGVKGLVRKAKGELQSERARKWDAEEAGDVSSWVSRSPAWALSVAFHLVAAVVLMNVVYFTQHDRIGQVFRMTLRASAPGGQEQGKQDNGINGKDNEDSAPSGKKDPDLPKAISGGEPPREVLTSKTPIKIDTGPTSGQDGPGGIYAGRGGAGRGKALRQFGGDGQSEQAVVDGLEWLAKHQDKNGMWDPEGFTRHCPKQDMCEGAGNEAYTGAVTGLCLLAYLGAGYSHMDDHLRPQDEGGPVVHAYTATITNGLRYLTKNQSKDGLIDPSGGKNMYAHGIASLAIVEAYSMTHDPQLRPYAQRAVNFICQAQQDSGGWNYSPDRTNRSDTSITSWQVMVLRSARAANLAVPKRVWDKARRFLHAVTNYETGNVGYCLTGPPTFVTPGCNAMIAIGMATRTYLGMPDDQQLTKKFVDQILKVPPRYDEVPGHCPNWGGLNRRRGDGHWSLYYTYYATLALFHSGGEAWEEWNKKMREATIPSQAKEGHQKGSWEPVVWDGMWGGRVYTTAFNVMNLEVYYRYLPCYQVGAEFGLAKLATDEEWDKVLADAESGKFEDLKGSGEEDPIAGKKPADKEPEAPKASDKTSEQLIEDLKSEDMMTRRNAAKELCAKQEKAAIEPLLALARGEKTSLRPVLIGYLGGYADSEAIVDFLIEALDEDQPRVRTAAMEALRKISGESFADDKAAWEGWRRKRNTR